ncbi:hypothetical protein GCM10018980_08100 [Streptomyces capoamus]|uniref:Uncharacterized protein n=1 Tax=Streptomyces capoamus TaxID=68183 RepID=A0A919C1Y8_9ACTN|nr:hypothetical protein [Streptomyces capoamus]GGW17388.1 hypothetical protein GCM10010501_37730 [Streptomyces libani subsp. rufus]GHG36924.1 hypothetical protein GCM10018980_08100 [Streptomyces capoamus]
MAWDEWEQLKADAAARGSTGMRLNHVPLEPGGGGGRDLKSDKKVWTQAGEDTKGLQDDVGKALGKLDDGQSGLGEMSGVQSAAAQRELYESWKKYVTGVKGRCGELGGLMERSGHDLAMSDGEVQAELEKIKAKYHDTEAVGGQAKDR